ncbi:MAG: glycosyltransferase [Verrucomicrobiota bacterium JB022]|nr:glycosyltransferase [Verrucomicrobiota bacterium JB022]
MPSHPEISVLVISYRFAPYLRQCLDSILGQTLRPSQVVVVDDHSPDESWEIIQEYAARYPGVVEPQRPPQNIGPREIGAFARQFPNRELFCWIDGDDYWHPQKLEREWAAMEATGAQVAYSNTAVVDEQGKITSYFHNPMLKSMPAGDIFMPVLMRNLFSNTPNMFRNHLGYLKEFKRVHFMPDLSLESGWDYEEKLMVAAHLKIASTDPREPMVFYRRHSTSYSQSSAGDAKHIRSELRILQKHRDLIEKRNPGERALGELYADLLIAANRQHLPAEQQAQFEPGKLYAAHKQRIQQSKVPEVQQLWKNESGYFRGFKLHEIKEKLIAGQDELALLAFIQHLPEDPQLLEAIFSLTPEMFGRLQRAYRQQMQKARRG